MPNSIDKDNPEFSPYFKYAQLQAGVAKALQEAAPGGELRQLLDEAQQQFPNASIRYSRNLELTWRPGGAGPARLGLRLWITALGRGLRRFLGQGAAPQDSAGNARAAHALRALEPRLQTYAAAIPGLRHIRIEASQTQD